MRSDSEGLRGDAGAPPSRAASEADVVTQHAAVPAGWREMSLGDVVDLKRGYDLPKRERLPGSVPLVSSSGITDYHAEAEVKGPGVVTGRYGTLGRVFFVLEDFWPLNTTLYVRDFKGNDSRFISYLLRTLEFLAYSDKAAVPGLNRNHLHQEIVRLPPLDEQRAIAHVLGTLDDKIELNRRMSATLEEMARALFRSWFVDFDPVRAKAEGRPSGLPPALAALFPASFEASELGPIPAGWRVAALEDVAAVTPGRSYKSSELDDSSVALVTLKSVRRGGGYQEGGLKPYTGRFGESQELRVGDIVVAKTDLTQGAEVIGRAARVPTEPDFDKLVASLDLAIIRPTDPGFDRPYLFEAVRDSRFVDHALGFTNGTTVLHLGRDALPTYELVLPTQDLMTRFVATVAPAYGLMDTNISEARTLADLLGTLLPKLISGEVRVGDRKP